MNPAPRWTTAKSALATALFIAALNAAMPSVAQAQVGCGGLQNAYGPLDFRTERRDKLKIVEDYHFGPEVESLIRGKSGSLGGDIDYTLRAFPNHPRALLAMMRLGEKARAPIVAGATYTVECYFERAIRFQRDDTTVRMLYAMFLYQGTRTAEAVQQLEAATELAKDNGFTHYNVGLVYLDHRNYERALVQAHRALDLGFTRPELKDRLLAAGKWSEPAASAAASAVSAPTGAAAPPAPDAAASTAAAASASP